MSLVKQKCFTYETFGDCNFGRNCTRSHKVWPYRTRTMVSTIVTKDIILPGVIEFLAESEDGTSRTQQYYISKGIWFSADAATGDIVEILISEKIHHESGCCCARISKILESASTSQLPSLMPVEFRKQQDCFDFFTYRDCNWGARCRRTHDRTLAYNQRFDVAKVLSVSSFEANGLEVHADLKSDNASQTRSRGYYIPDKFSCNVTEGNLVILQESSRMHKYTGMHFGKIITILHESQGLGETKVPLEVCVKSAFTFEPPVESASYQRSIVTAYSVESCSDHENCLKVGVHVRAAALGLHFKKLDQNFVPFHRTNFRNQVKDFDADSIRFALTMYAHSASDDVEGPFLTPLFIHSEFAFTFSDAHKYQAYLKHMWPLFGAKTFIDSVVNSLAASYMVDFPKTWRERYLVRQMLCFFNKEMSKFLQSKAETFVLVRNISLGNSITAKEVVIPAENLEMVESAWQLLSAQHAVEEREVALGFLLGSAKRSSEEFWEEQQLSDKYICEVVSCSDLQDNQSAMTTSPIGHAADFVNQQTVLSLMISPLVSLYTKNELLGTIPRRYRTPVILKAVVRQLTKTVVYLQLQGIFGRKRGNRPVWLDQIFQGTILKFKSLSHNDSDAGDGDDKPVDSISLILENLTSEEYCNSRLVRLSGERIAALGAAAIEQGVEASKVASNVCDLIATRQEYEAPYQLDKKGTLVTLGRGVELQLQVALKDDDDVGNYWLRLLRVGNGCHLCLIHLNYPNRAFSCLRRDTSGLIKQGSLKQMKEKIACNSLKTVILKEIAIQWNDYYFSGGTFTTVATIKPRNLLCIRKEIVGTNDHSIFVWTCHAVVSEVCDNLIRFLVCSLFQYQTPALWAEVYNGDFIVEVIDIDDKNVPES